MLPPLPLFFPNSVHGLCCPVACCAQLLSEVQSRVRDPNYLKGRDFVTTILNRRQQDLARFGFLEGDQGFEPVVHGPLQVLLASEIALSCQNRGVTNKKLNLLKLSSA
jgi:hypothetical protein